MSWAAVGQQTFNRSYTYDGVNRLATMSAPGSTCSGLSWSYDQWGHRTAQTVTGGTCGSSQLTFNSYNRVTNSGFQYDAAGNMTHDASHSYAYDAENRVTAVDGGSTATYGYDVDGRRVSRVVTGVETDYLYDLSGHAVAAYGGGCGSTCLNTAFMYSNGQLLAEYTSGTTYFVSADHLGSTRLLTGYPTASVVECDDYYPFGESISCGGTSTTTHKFTGYERDAETGLDNAQARYNSSTMGRFMSPDPVGNFVADATNPQTWNLYTYALNNPLRYIDPTGTDGLDYFDCIGSGNPPAACGGVDTTVYVYGNAPTWDQDPNPPQYPTDPCSAGGCSPTGGGGGGAGSSGVSNTLQKIKQAAVCGTGAPLIVNSLINGNGNSTTSVGGSFGFTYGDVAQGRDWNFSATLNGDSKGNVSFTTTTGYSTGYGVAGAGTSGGVAMGTSQGTVGSLNGSGSGVWAGYGPISASASRPFGSGFAVSAGRGIGAQYGAYNHTKTKSHGQTNCTGPAVSVVFKLVDWLFSDN